MDFKTLFYNSILISLVIVGLFAFAVDFQEENNVNDSISNNKLINGSLSNLKNNLQSSQTAAQSTKELFESENPTSGFGSILFFSVITAGKVFNNMIGANMNILIKAPTVVFGVDPSVVAALLTLLIFTIIIGLWLLYKLGG